ncbi:serine/threonine-protein phosphatase 7 long form homolog [Gastrolobium bilobum]|uniref:serine/threonine-protein phosphatase 7 long form homolog n=1 Tax=Gastrolobium bilobum TaxID=150636 RepID=UPI002AB26A36|nr:serine/threonine-protein phosphatase 7 long form homolog [Gastrolobium bilobum]
MTDSSSSESPRSTSDTEARAEPSDPKTHVLPGPYRWDVLRRRTQRTHVSQIVWNEEKCHQCKTRRDYLQQAGFLHVARMGHIQIDPMLISALVERWRPGTHTFHMTQGEMTITLQDVAAILGLLTDGRVVTGATSTNWRVLCEEVLGHAPLVSEQSYEDVKLAYLDRHYAHWGAVAADAQQVIFSLSVVRCRYIALLAGDFGDIGQYSLGSAVLAHLFRQRCELTDPRRSDMGGCHILLQIWAWTRFPPIAPPLPQPTHPEWHFGHRYDHSSNCGLHPI